MTDNKLKNYLKELQQVTPDVSWKVTNREILMSRILKDNRVRKLVGVKTEQNIIKDLLVFFSHSTIKFVAKPVAVVSLVTALILSTSVATVRAAMGSLPGDNLFIVKRSIEKATVSLTIGEDEKAKLEVHLAKNRLDELDKISQKTVSRIKMVQSINMAVDELKKDVEKAQNRLEKVKNENSSDDKALNLAKVIDTETDEMKISLNEKKDQVPEDIKDETNKKMNEAYTAIEETGLKAVSIIVEKHAAGETSITEDEVAERVNNKLESTKKKIEDTKVKINQLDETLGTDQNENKSTGTDSLENPVKDEAANNDGENKETASNENSQSAIDEAQKSATEAEDLLEEKDFCTALSKISETNDLVDQAEENVSASEEEVKQGETGQNVTETNVNSNTTENNVNSNIEIDQSSIDNSDEETK